VLQSDIGRRPFKQPDLYSFRIIHRTADEEIVTTAAKVSTRRATGVAVRGARSAASSSRFSAVGSGFFELMTLSWSVR